MWMLDMRSRSQWNECVYGLADTNALIASGQFASCVMHKLTFPTELALALHLPP